MKELSERSSTHIVYAHPVAGSLNGQILECVRTCLEQEQRAGNVTEALLHEQGFDPVLSADEHRGYLDRSTMDRLSTRYASQLEAADHAIFVFPVWIFGLPAILKGYFDKVWRPGVTFSLTPAGVRPRLTRLRRLTILCTFGQPREAVLARPDPIRELFVRQLAQNCSPDCELDYLPCFGCDQLVAREWAAHFGAVRALLR